MGLKRVGTASVIWREQGVAPSNSVKAEIERLVHELVALGAVRVVLFGSRARGDATARSDVDILAVMPCPPPGPFPRRLAAIYDAIHPKIGLDLLVYTPGELATLEREREFVRQAIEEGEVLYGDEPI